MDEMEFIWHQGEFVPWHQAKVHILTHSLHYGGAVFEGIRVYETDKGPAIFRLDEHIDRLFYSARQLAMSSSLSNQKVKDIIIELVDRNRMKKGYIRPLMYYGYNVMGLNPLKNPVEFSVACWPWGAYLPFEAIDITISPFRRIHPKTTVPDAKICGNYVNSQLASLALRGTKYHEALLLDTEGFVAEGPGENIFIVKDNQLLTPKLGNILPGITRDTLMILAKEQGYAIKECQLTVDDLLQADEAFFTGTAAEVTAIRSIDDTLIGDGTKGPVTSQLDDLYKKLVHGNYPSLDHYLTYVRQ
ncbi:branched-chain amino acid transaminase [Legionella sp. W05-934-2]|jgi:branched-chain amino acid aminotransferase|uniref:branched-chain amino acid transaminase n=1 Tax=Legionella sp. W05-934-2 TaxID=1198649 RepID=UPI0034634F18